MSPAERTTPGPRGGRRPITFFCQGGAGTRRPRGGDRDFVPGAAASLGVTAPARGAEGELESVRGVQGSGGGRDRVVGCGRRLLALKLGAVSLLPGRRQLCARGLGSFSFSGEEPSNLRA